jgi:ferric-dicitrate binding protein FerR (iron transport regulator)
MKNATNFIDFYNNLQSPFIQTDLELWDKIAERTREIPRVKIFQLNWVRYAAAAAVLIIVGATIFMRLYTETINSQKGEHLSYVLPDGSNVELNAETFLSFQPYWWGFSREVELSGEAFFDVEKGEKFKILSENGITEVIGTSFNIYARNSDYKVYCETGKVKVSSTEANLEFIIQSGELAIIDNIKNEGSITKANAQDFVSWKENKFVFTSELLTNVIAEIERQYDVKINLEIDNPSNLLYSGNFDKSPSVEITLNFVCKSFNLNFRKTKNKTYIIF